MKSIGDKASRARLEKQAFWVYQRLGALFIVPDHLGMNNDYRRLYETEVLDVISRTAAGEFHTLPERKTA